jgi:class 3 adenylate cyclase/tetratricopeptide (TPR) repeat protein
MDLAASPERSIVSVLAVDTVDSTGHIAGKDPDDAQELLDRIFRHLSAAIERAGGLIVSYAGDGGAAVFGWPNSQEDHADRACDAAWRIQGAAGQIFSLRNLDGRQIQFRVGIHSGLVGLRRMTIGKETRLDTVGGTVHLAAALQKNAPVGGILISSKTLELCQTELKLTPYDLPTLKRLNITAYRLADQPTRQKEHYPRFKYQHPIVGRDAELETLRTIFARSSNENRAIAIVGEPGIGKSRLVAAALDEAKASNVSLLMCRGDSQKSSTPYGAMRSLVLARLSLSDGASDDDIRAALKNVSMDESTAQTLGTILLTKSDQADLLTKKSTLTQVAREITLAFETLTAGQLVLVVVEDLHFLDPESVHCLRLLSKGEDQTHRTLIVTGRSEAMPEARDIADTVLRLAPLTRGKMKELALRLLSDERLPEPVLDGILDRADGIPFVLEQIILSIGALETSIVDLLPQSVQSVIHARLNRLPPRAKLLAQGLSVLGTEIEIDFALKTLDLDRQDVDFDRSELEKLEIIDSETDHLLRFHHAIVSEACLATVPGTRRQELHRAAIDAIKSMRKDVEAQYERLAFHAEGAQDYVQALEYLWLAALRARRHSASGSLDLMFRRAMRLVDLIGEAAESRFVDFVLMAYDPLQQLGQFRTMNSYLPRVILLAQKQGRKDGVCAALCHMSMTSWFDGRYSESLEQSEKALTTAAEINSLPLIFAAKFMLASALHGMGNMVRAIDLQRELCSTLSGKLERARLGAAGIPGSMVRSFLCWFLMEVGRYEEGFAHAERGLEIAQLESEPYSELLARLAMGRNLIKLGRDREAVECLDIAITLIEQNGYEAGLPHILGLLATALARSGGAERAVQMVEAWLESRQEQRTGRLELYYLNAGYSEALFRLGKVEQSLEAIDRALNIARDIKNPCLLVQGLGLRAKCRSAAGAVGKGECDLAEQSQLCEKYGLVA